MDYPPSVTGGPAPLPEWHVASLEYVVGGLVTDARRGLSTNEARRRLAASGPNALQVAAPVRPLRIALRQLQSPLVYVLLVAAVLSVALGHLTDAAFIGFVLLVNSALGAWQEYHAEQQSRGLQRLLRLRATVLRDGTTREIDAAELVPGDIVLLTSGQFVPADLRLLDSRDFEANESLLTGESLPVPKDANATVAVDAALADRPNCAYAGTSVVRGRAQGVVAATGDRTEVGRLARTMAVTVAGKPPLTERMERFSRTIAIVVLFAAVTIAVVAVLIHGHSPFTMFTFGVALAVSAIPEGLPVAVTVSLSIAARRMAARGAIVRQLPAVEGLGSCSLIASDKTGTLTCNELTVRRLWLCDGTQWEVSGVGYQPTGSITRVGATAIDESSDEGLAEALRIGAACNEAELASVDGRWDARGDPTDLALLALAGKRGFDREALLLERPVIAQVPYEPERRYAVSLHRYGAEAWLAVKGAPEQVLAMCELDGRARAQALAVAERLAAAGDRVLALASATRPLPRDPEPALAAAPTGLALVALVGLIDPLREGAAEAVADCARAGVQVVMVTGDHPLTALSIGRDLGIADSPEQVVHGAQLERADAAELRRLARQARIFARVTPEQKLDIVTAVQAAGHFVAVTGDGVNDAPALRRANIGIAMGKGGTDVAREASDLVLSDDNFRTIVAGVEEGRIAYQNIRNVVYLLTAAGIAEVLTVGAAVLAGLPLPLLPVQLLWLNLVTNGIQDVGLAFERGHGDELRRPPRPRHEPIFNELMLSRGLLAGLWMSALGLGAFVWMLHAGRPVDEARNTLLLLMVLMQNIDAINARSETVAVLRLPFKRNPLLLCGVVAALGLHLYAMYAPWLQRTLDVRPPTVTDWFVLPLVALSLMGVMEAQKAWRRFAAQPRPSA